LYRIREIIEKAVGGEPQLKARRLISAADLKRLNMSAVSPSISGDAARHAFDRNGSAPSKDKGISLDRSIELVCRMVSRWIESHPAY
jgi:hypothetical protein